MRAITIAMLLVTSNLCMAFNQQCQNLSYHQVKTVQQIISHHDQVFKNIPIIDYYCSHCLDQYVRPIVMESVAIERNGKYWNLLINQKVQNTAYLYLDNKNLGDKIGCNPKAVNKNLNF